MERRRVGRVPAAAPSTHCGPSPAATSRMCASSIHEACTSRCRTSVRPRPIGCSTWRSTCRSSRDLPVPLEGVEPEGLDAREALPPAELGAQGPALGAAPGTMPAPGTRPRLLSWDAVSQWERMLVARLGSDSSIPDAPSVGAFDRARAAVLPGWAWPEAPADVVRVWHSLVAPQWGSWTHVIGRYLAAKAHASWAMHLGTGPPAVERMVGVSRIVLQVEATRACLSRGARTRSPGAHRGVAASRPSAGALRRSVPVPSSRRLRPIRGPAARRVTRAS